MECEVYGKIFKDANISDNTITYKDLTVDFNALFQNDIYNSYITERCTSLILEGRNVTHFLVDVGSEQFVSLCKDGLANFLEETTKCKVSGWVCQGTTCQCLISDTELMTTKGSLSTPFKNITNTEVRSVSGFEEKFEQTLSDKFNSGVECLCVSFGFEIIPSIGSSTSKLFPEVNFIMFRSENLYISKYIADVSELKDRLINNVASTDLSANLIGFYLCGNFQCSATINLQKHIIKPQLTLAQHLQHILCFPAVNDIYSKSLFHKILKKQKLETEDYDPSLINTLKSDLQSLALDNVKLLSENEELHKAMDSTAIDMNNLLNSKNVLTDEVRQKLSNEQEIYNKLTELAVDKVKLKDVSEAKRYELMNKIFGLENELLDAHITCEDWKNKFEHSNAEKGEVEALKNDLQSEYISLKSNYHEVMSKQVSLEKRSEQLSLEVINLHMILDVENRDKIRKESIDRISSSTSKPIPQIPSSNSTPGSFFNKVDYEYELKQLRFAMETQQNMTKSEMNQLLQQILNLTQKNTQLQTKLSQIETSEQNKKALIEKTLQLQHTNEIFTKKLKTVQDQSYTLVQKNEELSDDIEQYKSQLNALSLTKTQVQAENTALRLKQRNAVEEYRIRLDCYIKDTANFLTHPNTQSHLKSHVMKLVEGYRMSFIERETCLQDEIKQAKEDLYDTLDKYHKLSAKDAEFSGVRVVQKELERLREENKKHKNELSSGHLLTAGQVEEMLKTLQEKYEGQIQHLKHKVTTAETQLARLMSHLNT